MPELPTIHKLFANSSTAKSETITPLLSGTSFTLEHIQSNRAASETDVWYNQETPEWVALIKGQATLQFESGTLELKTGDALLIEAHSKHRVSYTSSDATWLALHFKNTD